MAEPIELTDEQIRRGREAIAALVWRTNFLGPIDTGPRDAEYFKALSADEATADDDV